MKNSHLITEGDQFGRLTALGPAFSRKNHHNWLCRCVCGNYKVVDQYKLTAGSVRSCGCLRRETAKQNIVKAMKARWDNGQTDPIIMVIYPKTREHFNVVLQIFEDFGYVPDAEGVFHV